MPPYLFKERDEKLLLQYLLLTRQITALSDCIQHIIRLGNKKDDYINHQKYLGYVYYSMTELSDIYCQFHKMCELLGLDVEQTIKLGWARQEEKKKAYLKKNPDDTWI